MRVPNLQLAKGGGGEAGRAHHCRSEDPDPDPVGAPPPIQIDANPISSLVQLRE
jgi:hypothetical protein